MIVVEMAGRAVAPLPRSVVGMPKLLSSLSIFSYCQAPNVSPGSGLTTLTSGLPFDEDFGTKLGKLEPRNPVQSVYLLRERR